MRLPAKGRTVVRCPNQHEFETDMLGPEQLAIQRFVCELCGEKFSVDMPPPSPNNGPTAGAQALRKDSADKR